jgi:hypothetical protein
MTKDSWIVVFFVVIFIFSKKGLLGWNLMQYVTKNTYMFFNTSHFLYEPYMNKSDFFENVQILPNFAFHFEKLS